MIEEISGIQNVSRRGRRAVSIDGTRYKVVSPESFIDENGQISSEDKNIVVAEGDVYEYVDNLSDDNTIIIRRQFLEDLVDLDRLSGGIYERQLDHILRNSGNIEIEELINIDLSDEDGDIVGENQLLDSMTEVGGCSVFVVENRDSVLDFSLLYSVLDQLGVDEIVAVHETVDYTVSVENYASNSENLIIYEDEDHLRELVS